MNTQQTTHFLLALSRHKRRPMSIMKEVTWTMTKKHRRGSKRVARLSNRVALLPCPVTIADEAHLLSIGELDAGNGHGGGATGEARGVEGAVKGAVKLTEVGEVVQGIEEMGVAEEGGEAEGDDGSDRCGKESGEGWPCVCCVFSVVRQNLHSFLLRLTRFLLTSIPSVLRLQRALEPSSICRCSVSVSQHGSVLDDAFLVSVVPTYPGRFHARRKQQPRVSSMSFGSRISATGSIITSLSSSLSLSPPFLLTVSSDAMGQTPSFAFFPALGSTHTVPIPTPSASDSDSRDKIREGAGVQLVFKARLNREEALGCQRDGVQLQAWTDAPVEGRGTGEWVAYTFLQPDVDLPSHGLVDSEAAPFVLSSDAVVGPEPEGQACWTLKLRLRRDALGEGESERRFLLTYRLLYPNGEVRWLGSPGHDVVCVLQRADPWLDVSDAWAVAPRDGGRDFEARGQAGADSNSVEFARVCKADRWGCWAIGDSRYASADR